VTDFVAGTLLRTPTVAVQDVACPGLCRHAGAEECATATHLVFPYRGTFVRHLGRDDAVADANQALAFNAGEAYRVSHPVAGGDACLLLVIEDDLLRELAARERLRAGGDVAFAGQRMPIDPRAQLLVSLLRRQDAPAEPLETESLALELARRAVGTRAARAPGATRARRRLADRAKLVLAADPARRWTLSDVAAEVGGSPVYLTQVFRAVEGVPLYRYHLRLRLARALDLLAHSEDLAALSEDLGFSSHSHFTAAFRRAYGRAPADFRRATRGRRIAKDPDSGARRRAVY
jgi:AraC-like DNA-binding protein